jgi:hypothetical protein
MGTLAPARTVPLCAESEPLNCEAIATAPDESRELVHADETTAWDEDRA